MTVEERAIEVVDKLFQTPGAGMKHYNRDSFNRVLGPLIAEGMRELVKDCAKVVADFREEELRMTRMRPSLSALEIVEGRIHALAGKKVETEAAGAGDRFKAGEAIEISEKIRVRSEGKEG